MVKAAAEVCMSPQDAKVRRGIDKDYTRTDGRKHPFAYMM
jgi:hypothetical protein